MTLPHTLSKRKEAIFFNFQFSTLRRQIFTMKKDIADGLLQVALILSILRTDLNLTSYLNLVNNQLNYPEIHDIILGSTSAYTQTSNFHHNSWHDSGLSGYAHPKSINNYFASEVFRELHSLSHYRRFGALPTNVDSYLAVIGDGPAPLASESANDNSNNAADASSAGGGGVPMQQDNVGDGNNNLHPHPASPVGAIAPGESQSLPSQIPYPGSELTKEVIIIGIVMFT